MYNSALWWKGGEDARGITIHPLIPVLLVACQFYKFFFSFFRVYCLFVVYVINAHGSVPFVEYEVNMEMYVVITMFYAFLRAERSSQYFA